MASSSTAALPVVGGSDRRCRAWTLDNRLRRWWAPPQVDVDRLSIRSGHRVADLGTGVGYLVPDLLDHIGTTGKLILVDPHPRNLRRVTGRWGSDPRVEIVAASAEHLPMLGDDSMDRAVLSLVLCCMVNKAGALEEAWRIVRPGGQLLVTYPERRWRVHRRKRTLRVAPETWSTLVALRPWKVLGSDRRRLIRRHLLQKPVDGNPGGTDVRDR